MEIKCLIKAINKDITNTYMTYMLTKCCMLNMEQNGLSTNTYLLDMDKTTMLIKDQHTDIIHTIFSTLSHTTFTTPITPITPITLQMEIEFTILTTGCF